MCYGTLFYAASEEMVRYSGLTLKAALLVQRLVWPGGA